MSVWEGSEKVVSCGILESPTFSLSSNTFYDLTCGGSGSAITMDKRNTNLHLAGIEIIGFTVMAVGKLKDRFFGQK